MYTTYRARMWSPSLSWKDAARPEQQNYPVISSATGKGTPSYALSTVRMALLLWGLPQAEHPVDTRATQCLWMFSWHTMPSRRRAFLRKMSPEAKHYESVSGEGRI